MEKQFREKIFNLHEKTIDKSLGFAKGKKKYAKRWEVNMKVG